MSQFFTLLTKTGQGLLANAIAYGEPLTIATMAIGDGGGKLPTPDATVTRLVNEVRRGPINQTVVDDDNPNWTVVEQVLPADVGGWTIREVGLYDTDGNLIAYGNYPETYKPQLSEGSSRTQTIRFVMEVTDASAVTLKINPSVVMASRQYVDESLKAHAESRNHPTADTKNLGLLRFATLAESRKGEDAKAAQTPAGGKAQLDDHRRETDAHDAEQIGLKTALPDVFGDAKNVQAVLAMLGDAAKSGVGAGSGLDADKLDGMHASEFAGAFAADSYQNIAVFDPAGSYTFNVPDVLKEGLRKAWVTVTAGGGSGASAYGTGRGGGGGAGGTSMRLVDLAGIDSVRVTVGAGGKPAAGANASGNNGSSSSFGSYVSATGGGAGAGNSGAGGAPGFGHGGDINMGGGNGSDSNVGVSGGGSSDGANSMWGGAGRSGASGTGTAADANAPGAGGGGSAGASSGSGADGIVIVRW